MSLLGDILMKEAKESYLDVEETSFDLAISRADNDRLNDLEYISKVVKTIIRLTKDDAARYIMPRHVTRAYEELSKSN